MDPGEPSSLQSSVEGGQVGQPSETAWITVLPSTACDQDPPSGSGQMPPWTVMRARWLHSLDPTGLRLFSGSASWAVPGARPSQGHCRPLANREGNVQLRGLMGRVHVPEERMLCSPVCVILWKDEVYGIKAHEIKTFKQDLKVKASKTQGTVES